MAAKKIASASIEELNAEIRKASEVLGGDVNKHYLHEGILDLHKPYVDEIILVSDSGKPMKRVPDLIDVWFDSGAMPYAQWHYPFENKELVDNGKLSRQILLPKVLTRPVVGFIPYMHWECCCLIAVAYKTVVSNGLGAG